MARFGYASEANGRGNVLLIHREARAMRPAPMIFHGEGNVVVIDAGCAVDRSTTFNGNGALAAFMGPQDRLSLQSMLYDDATMVVGRDVTAYEAQAWVSHGRTLTIGDDCLFAAGVTLNTTDHHSLIDLDTHRQINWPADIRIGRHVWLGADVAVLKGVTIGDGAVLGARALVNRSTPAGELWAGIPARRLRRRTSWVNHHPAHPHQIDAMLDGLGAVAEPRRRRLFR